MATSNAEQTNSAPRILLIDDEPATRTQFRRILEEVGYLVHEAGNGREALRALEHRNFEAIVLDLAMPEMDGLEFLRRALDQLPGVRIAVISGFMKGPMLRIAEHLGAHATLTKPTSPEQLLDVVFRMLDVHSRGVR